MFEGQLFYMHAHGSHKQTSPDYPGEGNHRSNACGKSRLPTQPSQVRLRTQLINGRKLRLLLQTSFFARERFFAIAMIKKLLIMLKKDYSLRLQHNLNLSSK